MNENKKEQEKIIEALESIRDKIRHEEERAKELKLKDEKKKDNNKECLKNFLTLLKCCDYLNIEKNFFLKKHDIEMKDENTKSNKQFEQIIKAKDSLTNILQQSNGLKEMIIHLNNETSKLQRERTSLDNLIKEFNGNVKDGTEECCKQLRMVKAESETKLMEMNKKIKRFEIFDEQLCRDEESQKKELRDRENDLEKITKIIDEALQPNEQK
ncbi:hypothetical protein SNEBB_005721 [Seison nebaliae]|nr:hypothetical protein SNEBB_005721 [Seison nebaliae]